MSLVPRFLILVLVIWTLGACHRASEVSGPTIKITFPSLLTRTAEAWDRFKENDPILSLRVSEAQENLWEMDFSVSQWHRIQLPGFLFQKSENRLLLIEVTVRNSDYSMYGAIQKTVEELLQGNNSTSTIYLSILSG